MRGREPLGPMNRQIHTADVALRRALEASGLRFTGQRAAVFRFLRETESHPTAEEVFQAVRSTVPGISLATVYKNLETLVGCGLATKLARGDGSARYDGRTDLHHHARCLACNRVTDLPGGVEPPHLSPLDQAPEGFRITGYRLELEGYCPECAQEGRDAPPAA